MNPTDISILCIHSKEVYKLQVLEEFWHLLEFEDPGDPVTHMGAEYCLLASIGSSYMDVSHNTSLGNKPYLAPMDAVSYQQLPSPTYQVTLSSVLPPKCLALTVVK